MSFSGILMCRKNRDALHPLMAENGENTNGKNVLVSLK
jgi:hypothetical protein